MLQKWHYFILFLWLSNIPLCVYLSIYLSLSIYRCIYIYAPRLLYPFVCWWHLLCFHVLNIVNSAAVNMECRDLFKLESSIFPGYMSRSGIARSYSSSISFLILFSIVATPTCNPTSSVGGFPFPHTFFSIFIYRLCDDNLSDHCEVVPHCSFDLHFSNY